MTDQGIWEGKFIEKIYFQNWTSGIRELTLLPHGEKKEVVLILEWSIAPQSPVKNLPYYCGTALLWNSVSINVLLPTTYYWDFDVFILISDIFTQVSDTQGYLVRNKFEEFLKDILTLPTAVYEGPSFGYNETAGRACFDGVSVWQKF